MSHQFAVVAEAAADHLIATELADRVLLEAIDWLDDQILPTQRQWIIAVSGEPLTWKRIRKLAMNAGIEAEGYFDGRPGLADARAARRALRFLREVVPNLDAVILVRDQDDQKDRRKGLDQARKEDHEGLVIVVGLAIIEREAWILSGFEPKDPNEQMKLDVERQNLGFNPCERSHELTAAKDDTAPRSPKRTLRQLSEGDFDRERSCWMQTTLELLITRGAANGLASYLEEVRRLLAPVIG